MQQQLDNISPVSILSLLETDKAQRQSFAAQVMRSIDEGSVNPLLIHLQLKCTESLIKAISETPEYKKALLDESAKHGKSFYFHNAKIETKEVGTKYDFTQCGDPIYTRIAANKDIWDEKLKERETFLKNVPESGLQIMDDDTGELITIYRPSKSSTTSIAVTLK